MQTQTCGIQKQIPSYKHIQLHHRAEVFRLVACAPTPLSWADKEAKVLKVREELHDTWPITLGYTDTVDTKMQHMHTATSSETIMSILRSLCPRPLPRFG